MISAMPMIIVEAEAPEPVVALRSTFGSTRIAITRNASAKSAEKYFCAFIITEWPNRGSSSWTAASTTMVMIWTGAVEATPAPSSSVSAANTTRISPPASKPTSVSQAKTPRILPPRGP